ncbi:hypothetical protein DID88_008360 [Monilinia fructigena]|uniref:Kinesin light chain n=1 Tax=Monilinia fructigena TaxID=38457 RepID=A0A395J558_9HELO|nr:hypothetical protein DID88_008360 [Monilinia fructigena]
MAKTMARRSFERENMFRWDETSSKSCDIKEGVYHILSSLVLNEEALIISRQLYQVNLRIDRPKSVKTVRSKAMLWKSLRILGNLEKAERLQRETLEYDIEDKDEDDSVSIESTIELAEILQGSDELDKAEVLWRNIIEIQAEIMGESHPGTLKSKIALTRVLIKVAKINEANEVFTGMLDTMGTWAVVWGDDEEMDRAFILTELVGTLT